MTFWIELGVPWTWFGNDRVVGLTVTVWENAGRKVTATKQTSSEARETVGPILIEPPNLKF
ncbi:MAG: hypothetical protein DMG77_14630 [Acidobacteria bacterium]|nr:MAG: hypothetical protein DMG77_14630 [Acidobacteriota bacterium]